VKTTILEAWSSLAFQAQGLAAHLKPIEVATDGQMVGIGGDMTYQITDGWYIFG